METTQLTPREQAEEYAQKLQDRGIIEFYEQGLTTAEDCFDVELTPRGWIELPYDALITWAQRILRPEVERVDWQPIETAPLDEKSDYLVFTPGYGVWIGRYDNQSCHLRPRPYWRGYGLDSYWWRARQPTHWAPLPSGPAALSEQDGVGA